MSLLATAPIPSSLRSLSISSPRFLRVNLRPSLRASARTMSPDTKTGIFWALITLDARLLPAPGIPTMTITVFLALARVNLVRRAVQGEAVIALNQEMNEATLHVKQSRAKLRVDRFG